MKIDFKKQNIPFTQVANGVLNDSNLSAEAKGLYAYLYSKPDGWQFNSIRIAQDFKNGRDAIRNALAELEEVGYLVRYKLPNGRMFYKVIFPPLEPEPENQAEADPKPEKAKDWKTHRRIIRPISNKENTSNKELNTSNEGSLQALIPEILKEFETIDPKNKTYYGNKTQRSACEFLLKEYGLERTLKAIKMLPVINQQKLYIRQITTPYELKENWVKIGNAIKVQKDTKKSNVAFK